MAHSESWPEVVRHAIVVAPAHATAIAGHLARGARVIFLDGVEGVRTVPIEAQCYVAVQDAESMVALLHRQDVAVTSIDRDGDCAVLLVDVAGASPRSFNPDEVIELLIAASGVKNAGGTPVDHTAPHHRDAETTALRREIATLRDENRRHRSRITKIKRHPLGKLGLRAHRLLRTLKK